MSWEHVRFRLSARQGFRVWGLGTSKSYDLEHLFSSSFTAQEASYQANLEILRTPEEAAGAQVGDGHGWVMT